MNPKMKSAIEKITLNDATFSNEVIEPTYVNFFYGKNGAGKSTIARTFKARQVKLPMHPCRDIPCTGNRNSSSFL